MLSLEDYTLTCLMLLGSIANMQQGMHVGQKGRWAQDMTNSITLFLQHRGLEAINDDGGGLARSTKRAALRVTLVFSPASNFS